MLAVKEAPTIPVVIRLDYGKFKQGDILEFIEVASFMESKVKTEQGEIIHIPNIFLSMAG